MRKNFILVITLAVLLFPVMSAPADGAGTITGRMLMKDGTPIIQLALDIFLDRGLPLVAYLPPSRV